MQRFGGAWLLSMGMCACGTTGAASGPEFFDEATGNTLTVVARPIVFARERTDAAAHARDYATLVAIDVDHSGSAQQYLLLYRWSTVDARMLGLPHAAAGMLRLVSDGRDLRLQPLASLPIGAELKSKLHAPDPGDSVTHAYVVDAATLRFIAASRTLTLQLPDEALDTPFRLWEDGRRALRRFVEQTIPSQ